MPNETDGKRPATEKQQFNATRALLLGIAGPLITAMIFGYVTLYINHTKLVTIADLTERRLTSMEVEAREQLRKEREIQIMMTRQGEKLDMIHKELLNLKEEQKELDRRTSRQ